MTNNGLFKPVGIYPAMATPFDEEGKVNEKELRKLTRWLINMGVTGLFPMGSTGEFVHLDIQERIRVIEIVTDENKGQLPVIPGAVHSCYSKCVEIVQAAKDLGCQAALLAPPYYFTLPQEMIEAHFESIARKFPGFSLLVYNIPLFAIPISYEVIQRLSRLPNIVAMKDSSGSMVDILHFMDKIRIAGEELNILVGRDEVFYPSLIIGASGLMSGCSLIVPEIMIEIYDAFKKKDHDRAMKAQRSILELLRVIFGVAFPLGVKMALEIRGFSMGPPKQKLSNAEQYNYLKVKSRMQNILEKLLGNNLIAKI